MLSKNHGDSLKMIKYIQKERNKTKQLLELEIILNKNLSIYINNANFDKWAIIVHGMGSSANSMTPIISKFIEYGYNTITLETHRSRFGFANNWEKDILNALDFCKNNLHCKINLAYGQSFGASSIIDIAARGKYIFDKIIVDSPYASIGKSLNAFFPYLNIATLPLVAIMNIPKNIPKKLSRLDTPIIVFYGKNDELVKEDQSSEIEANIKNGEIYYTDNAGHCRSMYYEPENYWNNIEKFLENDR